MATAAAMTGKRPSACSTQHSNARQELHNVHKAQHSNARHVMHSTLVHSMGVAAISRRAFALSCAHRTWWSPAIRIRTDSTSCSKANAHSVNLSPAGRRCLCGASWTQGQSQDGQAHGFTEHMRNYAGRRLEHSHATMELGKGRAGGGAGLAAVCSMVGAPAAFGRHGCLRGHESLQDHTMSRCRAAQRWSAADVETSSFAPAP